MRKVGGGLRSCAMLASRTFLLMKASLSERRSSTNQGVRRLGMGLGWFSVALGMAGLFAPQAVARMIGVRCRCALLQALGIRGIISGIGILRGRRTRGWLWSRVVGNSMDLGLLSTAFADKNSNPRRLGTATAAVIGVTALDIFAATRHGRSAQEGITVQKTIMINRPADELFQFWRDFHNLPRFMRHLSSVWVMDEKRSHWVVRGPGGIELEWESEITEEIPGNLIRWQSLPGADVDNAGSVSFEPAPGGDRGTIVRVEMTYHPPGGKIGAAVAKLFGKSPERQLAGDLSRFEQLMETGEITTTEGQPAGRSTSTSPIYDVMIRR